MGEEEETKKSVPEEEKIDDSKALVLVEPLEQEAVVAPPSPEKILTGSVNRDAVLARVSTDKKTSLIKAWEDSEKSKAANKAEKKISSIMAWENWKKASLEAELRKMEENLEKKKAEYNEKMKNKIVMIHKAAEEKRAMVEAQKGEELLKAEEYAAKSRATGLVPKNAVCCFGS